MVKLSSSDGQEFTVAKEIACLSVLIRNMIEDLGDDREVAVPLPNVTGTVLAKVIEYATHHKDDPIPSPEDEKKIISATSEDIDAWDREYIKVSQDTLFEIILAANYLDIKGLLDLGCKTVANMIKGKTLDEIRKEFPVTSTGA
ncbi:hypothetical protein BASA50_009381 [Batrachochytrium salamandrivorans]|uniref:E3 ubiquitin ligase complex SCF subunit n=1 Tax=Batrachochytrium salamandrivorans TaxID=1357716 RepID=A0ABQ8F1Y6_9FUNG|nr:hypothetical protein BASA62_008463 [Batrachochytrium salamandrivorans]KAH6577333.1 hypothetical protein BASA60_004074 [Batrachochytrium salamandrivorans]KAH6580545.1 hypothetical protein BASA61_009557 [Batrachochytrium salamandrivorans]KAH6588406.1 hypothetical protein BASA61_005950 [Batrachochytrium salamandrivorans]KAH6588411.1 hypothetical protein BASA61_005955 [Batrachochytrium salamandrivorans]